LARRGRYRDVDEHLAVAMKLFTAERLDCGGLRVAWREATAQRHRRLPGVSTAHADEQAYDCYLMGRQNFARMMQQRLEESRQMFDRAVELEPGYGPAWAGLATVQAYLNEWFDAGKSNLARAEQASRRALEAAPKLAEAHTARALVQAQLGEHDDAAREFEAAIRINPYLFEPYYFFGRTAFSRGDMERAAEMFALAAQAQPYQAQQFVSPMEGQYGMPYGAQQYNAAARSPYYATAPVYSPAPVYRAPARTTARRSSSGSQGTYYPAPARQPVRHTKRDAAIGAAAGAVIGAVSSRDKVKGGLIGAAAGGILGGIIGHTVDVRREP
jgi:tetratricopeptide (TPR) repeat protein